MSHLVDPTDVDAEALTAILCRADELAAGSAPRDGVVGSLLATLFVTASMRTRVGFEVAAHRSGMGTVRVDGLRFDRSMSASESFDDALRVVAGMVDVVVTRVPFTLERGLVARMPAAVVNGGDATEHPTQALIDLAAIERFGPPLPEARIGLVGDLSMRAVRSLLQVLEHRPPASITLVHPDSRSPAVPASLAHLVRRADLADASDVDVLMMIGLPPGRGDEVLDDAARAPYVLTGAIADTLSARAVVLSPMPVIDEIDVDARRDRRIRMFEQSDHAVYVRAAVLEHVLRGNPTTS